MRHRTWRSSDQTMYFESKEKGSFTHGLVVTGDASLVLPSCECRRFPHFVNVRSFSSDRKPKGLQPGQGEGKQEGGTDAFL